MRVVVLGAGFGGLELATVLSETGQDMVDVTLIDRNDAFVFGYSKLDVMFAEGAARVAAESLLATLRGEEEPPPYDGRDSCCIEFGAGRVGRVDIDFLTGPKRTVVFREPSAALVAEKQQFGASRRACWFAAH